MKKDAKKIDKNGKEMTKNISYKLQFIDSAIFMTSSSSHFFFFYIYIFLPKQVINAEDMVIKM